MAVCMFVYGTNLSSFIMLHTNASARSKEIICMLVCRSVRSFLFFSLKAYRSKKKFSLKKMKEEMGMHV